MHAEGPWYVLIRSLLGKHDPILHPEVPPDHLVPKRGIVYKIRVFPYVRLVPVLRIDLFVEPGRPDGTRLLVHPDGSSDNAVSSTTLSLLIHSFISMLRNYIIGIREIDIFPFCNPDPGISRTSRSSFISPDEAHPVIFIGKRLRVLITPVCRAVINKYHFPVLKGLRNDRAQAFLDILSYILYRYDGT